MGSGRKAVAGFVATAALAVTVVVLVLGGGGEHSARSPTRAVGPPGGHARFVFLASQNSNQCGLPAAAIAGYSGSHRLQGSCCSAMDEHAYREQLQGLRPYRGTPQIPRDPYDIAASSAQRLLRYDRTISLSGPQRRTYARAMSMSDQKGPCCCRC
jgi:hypothetical protein